MNLKPIQPVRWVISRRTTAMLIAVLLALSGCAESTQSTGTNDSETVGQDNQTGGSGGDDIDPQDSDGSGSTDAATNLLTPFVGTYDLTGLWNGTPDDEALLVIRDPADNGVSEVVIYDFLPEPNNCYSALSGGIASKEPIGDRVFLDRILQFDDAILSLAGTTLVIDYFDTLDVDGDGDANELINYRASAVAQMESDIQPICP